MGRRIAPFGAVHYLALLSLLAAGVHIDKPWFVAGLAGTLVLTVAVWAVPWERLPDVLQPTIPLLYIVDLFALAVGARASGLGSLVILPVLWFVLYGVRWELLAALGLIALRFVVPIWLDAITGTTASNYRGAFLFTLTCGLVGLVGQSLVRDLRATARREATALASLARANSGLERSNAELEEFAYVASHELHEPLRSIGGFVDLLEQRYRGKLDEDANRFMGFIVAGVGRMQALIDDLLRYSRSQQDELQYERVDSRELVAHTLSSLDAAVRETGADVELGELPTLVADRRRLEQVFQNLLSNALKFTDGQRPRVTVSSTSDAGAWTFAVADNGVGMDPAHEGRAFRMFQRLHSREEYAGTGMGLAICKRSVERHGGRIWCERRPGGGMVFRFTIPNGAEGSA